MDLTFTERELAFRDELREWLADNPPGPAPDGGEDASYAWRRDWQRKLYDGGWAGVHWPTEYGGRGASLTETAIFFEELGRARAPLPANVLGLLLAGPTIMIWGTDEQKERYLAADPLRRGDLVPGLLRARRRLRPRRAEDPRGPATATSGSSPARRCGPRGAQYSKWCMLVARTDQDAPKHKGLTYFLMDMEQDGGPGPAAAPDHRRARVQRAVHRGGADPRRERRSAAWATAGRSR